MLIGPELARGLDSDTLPVSCVSLWNASGGSCHIVMYRQIMVG